MRPSGTGAAHAGGGHSGGHLMRLAGTLLLALAAASGCASVFGPDSDAAAGGRERDGGGEPDFGGVMVDFANADLTLGCGIGFRLCGDHCVGPNECCLSSECSAPAHGTSTCTNRQCSTACDTGFALCNGACIPGQGACCQSSDCPPPFSTDSTQCIGSVCKIGMCKAGFYDLDNYFGNGCECADSGFGASCNAATSLGTIGTGGTFTRTGVLPTLNGEAWFSITFAYVNTSAYHPRISLSSSAGEALVFDLYNNCGGGTLTCGTEGGASTARTAWETTGGGEPGGQTFAPTPSVGTLYLRVRRPTGAPSCAPYTLTVLN